MEFLTRGYKIRLVLSKNILFCELAWCLVLKVFENRVFKVNFLCQKSSYYSTKVIHVKAFSETSSEKEYPSVLTVATIVARPGNNDYIGIAMAQVLKSQKEDHGTIDLGTWKQTVTMDSDGAIYIENTMALLNPEVKHLPRRGIELSIPGMMKDCCFFAQGPHENYADRQVSAHLGVYEEEVPERPSTYIVPQEQGNRMQLNWA